MKQITLKEAFEKAVIGPIKPERQQNNLTGLFGGLGGSHHIAEMSANKETAALIAHCFNTYQELVEALKFMSNHWPPQPPNSPAFGAYSQAMEAIKKANRVTIP
jgi:hypothetical protein